MRDYIKTATYGVMHMAVAICVAYALSGSWAIAIGIGLLEPLVQTFFYNLHERIWSGPGCAWFRRDRSDCSQPGGRDASAGSASREPELSAMPSGGPALAA